MAFLGVQRQKAAPGLPQIDNLKVGLLLKDVDINFEIRAESCKPIIGTDQFSFLPKIPIVEVAANSLGVACARLMDVRNQGLSSRIVTCLSGRF